MRIYIPCCPHSTEVSRHAYSLLSVTSACAAVTQPPGCLRDNRLQQQVLDSSYKAYMGAGNKNGLLLPNTATDQGTGSQAPQEHPLIVLQVLSQYGAFCRRFMAPAVTIIWCHLELMHVHDILIESRQLGHPKKRTFAISICGMQS